MTEENQEVDRDHNKPVTKSFVKNVSIRLRELDAKSSKIKGERSAVFKQAEDNNCHKEALKLSIKLEAMDEASRSAYLEAFDLYRDYLGLDEYEQGSFNMDDVTDPQEDETEEDGNNEEDGEEEE